MVLVWLLHKMTLLDSRTLYAALVHGLFGVQSGADANCV